MSNVLTEQQQHDIRALGRLGWSLRQIERRTGVRRETIRDYLKAAGIPVRTRGGAARACGRSQGPNPATTVGVSTDPSAASSTRAPITSACEIYREVITDALGRGRNAMAIWQDLVDAPLRIRGAGFVPMGQLGHDWARAGGFMAGSNLSRLANEKDEELRRIFNESKSKHVRSAAMDALFHLRFAAGTFEDLGANLHVITDYTKREIQKNAERTKQRQALLQNTDLSRLHDSDLQKRFSDVSRSAQEALQRAEKAHALMDFAHLQIFDQAVSHCFRTFEHDVLGSTDPNASLDAIKVFAKFLLGIPRLLGMPDIFGEIFGGLDALDEIIRRRQKRVHGADEFLGNLETSAIRGFSWAFTTQHLIAAIKYLEDHGIDSGEFIRTSLEQRAITVAGELRAQGMDVDGKRQIDPGGDSRT